MASMAYSEQVGVYRQAGGSIGLTAALSASRRRAAASTKSEALDDGEALAATRAARGEHTTTAGRPHARAKSVHTRTSAGLRLIGALQGRVPSPAGTKRSKNDGVCTRA